MNRPFIGFLVVLFAYFSFVMQWYKQREARNSPQAKMAACQLNMRLLHGAIEYYNIDQVTRIETIDADTEKNLLACKYLKAPLVKPDLACKYTMKYDKQINCAVHGLAR